ncbi:hypothetical protein BJ875DRAFT_450017 [Amylocarpus encephaloides]|uniref:Oxidoreductase n=1 Tax=Amylocarpus encephaloides TaxID=45428 RepID=A0A9P7YSG4_9HELO|nr:hypothetical protein BJ875DRAFT_450017 [Amylocarpus encephaloides]
MPALTGFVNFNPEKDIGSLKGKVIFITGGTAGLGSESVQALAKHDPAHIYFSGRNARKGEALIEKIKRETPTASLTFIEIDLSSLASVKAGSRKFAHDRLDILICNAGIMEAPPELSKDGYEIHFATNHLGHAMLIREFLPLLVETTKTPGADVRVVILTSVGAGLHPKCGVDFQGVLTKQDSGIAKFQRYSVSKFANVVYASEIARRHPDITAVSVHPGVVETDLVLNLAPMMRRLVYIVNFMKGVSLLKPQQGALNQLWVAAGSRKDELVNGAYYEPVGVMCNHRMTAMMKNERFAGELWDWTEKALDQVD